MSSPHVMTSFQRGLVSGYRCILMKKGDVKQSFRWPKGVFEVMRARKIKEGWVHVPDRIHDR